MVALLVYKSRVELVILQTFPPSDSLHAYGRYHSMTHLPLWECWALAKAPKLKAQNADYCSMASGMNARKFDHVKADMVISQHSLCFIHVPHHTRIRIHAQHMQECGLNFPP